MWRMLSGLATLHDRAAVRCLIAGLAWPFIVAGCSNGGGAPSATPTVTRPANTATVTPTPIASPSATATASPTPDERLRTLASAAGVFVGAAFVEGNEDPQFRAVLTREFNSTTAPVYWAETQPDPGTFNFTNADTAVAIAEANGMRVRGHPLIWGRLALPAYVEQIADPAQLRTLMTERIQTVVGRYRGRIAQYDVVNEPLTLAGGPGPGGDGLADYIFSRLLGPGYIREALDIAHAADPDAELFINDFFVEQPGPKQDYFYALARHLVESGAPLTGVGFQGHLMPPFSPGYLPTREDIAAAIGRFTDLGLIVEITELDVSLSDPGTQLDLQAAIYADVFTACFTTPGCRGITTWAISDKYTWIRNFYHVEAAPLLFDETFMPKPAYYAVRDVLRAILAARGSAADVDSGPRRSTND